MKYQALRPQFLSVGGWRLEGWGGGGGCCQGGCGVVGSGGGVVFGMIRLSLQSNSNSQKLSLWCKKIIVNLMKDLKYEHQSTFPLLGRVKLNFRDRYRKLDIFSKNSSHYQVFSSNSQKMTLWCKKKIITHPDGFV